MKQDTHTTKTVFRTWNDGFGTIALFPQIPADLYGFLCNSYEHVGQHGAVDTQIVVSHTRPATTKEYRPLAKELRSLGYRLDIQKRCTYHDIQIRMKEAKA